MEREPSKDVTISVRPELLAPLSAEEARTLTDEITRSGRRLGEKFAEARDRRAWEALGYPSWDDYLASEFSMTERNANNLIKQAEVFGELEAVTGVTLPDETTSARAAAALAPVLPVVVEAAKEAAKGKRGQARQQAVADAVDQARKSAQQAKEKSGSALPDPPPKPKKINDSDTASKKITSSQVEPSEQPEPSSDRVLQAASVLPRILKLDASKVAAAMDRKQALAVARLLHRWSVDFASAANGFKALGASRSEDRRTYFKEKHK